MQITRGEFADKAPSITVTIDGLGYTVYPKPVEDGKSLGYYLSAKQDVEIAGKRVRCQVGLNITVIGSKE